MRRHAISVLASMALCLCGSVESAEDKGAMLFDQHCGTCHTVAEISAPLKAQGGEQERASARLREFLSRHGDADEAQVRAIIEYLQHEANRG